MSYPTYEEVVELKKNETKNIWVYLSQKHNEDKESLRGWFRRESERRTKEAEEILLPIEEVDNKTKVEESYSYDDKGKVKFVSSTRVIRMHEEDSKSVEFVLKAHGFNPNEWILVSCLNNYWQGLRPNDEGSATLYQSKITVKPKTEISEITFDDIESFFKNFKSENTSFSDKIYFSKSKKKLIINIADAHFGNDTDGFSAKESIFKLVGEIKEKSKHLLFEEIILINLGDLLHIDNYAGQTTSGTQVGERGSYYAIWEDALQTMIFAIDELKGISKVKYVSISGNHDKVSSFSIGKAIEYYYKNDLNVSTDCDFQERKYIRIGNSIFGLAHGDLPSKNVPSILQREAREEYGKTKYAYMLLGHVHHVNITDKDGVIVSYLPSITPSDDWHKGQAYTGTWKGTFCYVVDDENGITDTWHISA